MFHMLGYGMESAMIPLYAWFGVHSEGLNIQMLALFESIAPELIHDEELRLAIRVIQSKYSHDFSRLVYWHLCSKRDDPKDLSRRKIIKFEDLALSCHDQYEEFLSLVLNEHPRMAHGIWIRAKRCQWIAETEHDLEFILLMMMFGVYNPLFLDILYSKLMYLGNRQNHLVMALFDGLLEGGVGPNDRKRVENVKLKFSAAFNRTYLRHRDLAGLCRKHRDAICDWTKLHELESVRAGSATLREFCSKIGRGDELAIEAWKAFGRE
jgi:hypothetical protein